MMRKLLLPLGVFILCIAAGCSTRSEIKKALSDDPELLMEVLRENRFELLELIQNSIDEQQALERQKRFEASVDNPVNPVPREYSVVEGREDAPITIFEYSDFLCPYCVRGHRTMNSLLKKYPEKIRLIYKHNPLKDGALGLAALYEAVARTHPDKATELKKMLFERQSAIYKAHGQGAVVGEIIKELGLDVKELQAVAKKPEILQAINADIKEAQEFELSGTPMYIVGGAIVRGALPMQDFETIIELVEARDAAE